VWKEETQGRKLRTLLRTFLPLESTSTHTVRARRKYVLMLVWMPSSRIRMSCCQNSSQPVSRQQTAAAAAAAAAAS
jgi:hypothetical protein